MTYLPTAMTSDDLPPPPYASLSAAAHAPAFTALIPCVAHGGSGAARRAVTRPARAPRPWERLFFGAPAGRGARRWAGRRRPISRAPRIPGADLISPARPRGLCA